MATIVREFDNGVILYGRREVQPEQRSDTGEEPGRHTADDAQNAYGSGVTPNDTQSNREVEMEPQLPIEEEISRVQEEQWKELLLKGQDLRKPENRDHEPRSMLSELLISSCDPQPSQEEAEARGDPPGENTQDSESDRTQSSDHGPERSAVVSPRAVPVPVPQLPSWNVLPPGSKAKGVSYHKHNKQWEAHLWIQDRQLRNRRRKGVQIFVGNYSTEFEAKQAHDRAAIKFEVRTSGRTHRPYALNFHESAQADFIEEHRDWSPRDFLWKLRRYSLKFSSGKSNMKGVTVRESFRKPRGRRISRLGEDADADSAAPAAPAAQPASGSETAGSSSISPSTVRYEAKIARTDGKKMTCAIGTFASEEDAGKAYDRALLFLSKDKGEVELWHVITNFRPSNYTAEEVLEAGKKLVFKKNSSGDLV